MVVSTQRVTVVEFVAGKIVFGLRSEPTSAELGAKLLQLASKAPELGLGVLVGSDAIAPFLCHS
jgi:hypothetical protein